MFFISVGLWGVVLYNFRAAMFGSAPYRLVTSADPDFLEAVARVAAGDNMPVTQDEFVFLKRFSRLTMLELGMFILEVGILVFLFLSSILEWLSFILLCKNLLMIAVGATATRGRLQNNIFKSLVALPQWLIVLDRVSAALSAVGAFILFLALNEIYLW